MPDSFEPDSFEPDTNDSDSFVADSFTPDTPVTPQQNTEDWRTGGVLDPNKSWGQKLDVILSGPDQLRDAFGKPDSTSILPTFKQPETYWGGFANSLYNDFIRPLASPEGFVGSSTPGKVVAEILPAEQPLVKGLLTTKKPPDINILPPGDEPLIVGKNGRIQKQSLITPQEEARLAGYPDDLTGPISTGDRSVGTILNINELRERERLKALTYGEFEHTGGTPLIVPDRPAMQQPPVSGDTGLGFSAQSTGDLEYPLNVVPNAVRPRSVQAVTEALAGAETARPITKGEPVTFESSKPVTEPPVTPVDDLAGGTASIKYNPKTFTPMEPMLPSAAKAAKVKVAENTGLNIPDKVSIPADTPAPIADAVEKGVQAFIKSKGKPSELTTSISTQLREFGPAGIQLEQKFRRASQNRAEYIAAWTEPLISAGRKLSSSEKANFGAYVEGRLPIPNQKVQNVVDAWRDAESMAADMAESKGLHLRREGNTIPFERIKEGYWTHRPVPELNVDEESIIDKLVNEGMSRHDATNVAQKWQKTGEIFLRGQHSRFDKFFRYRDDFDAGIEHLNSMARRIANHEHLGPKDIAGVGNTGIANLIEDTGSNKDIAYSLAKRLVMRDAEKPRPELVNGLNKARRWMSLTSLPNFGFVNVPLGQVVNAQWAIASRHPAAAIWEMRNLFKSAYRDELRASGAFNSFTTALAEEMNMVKGPILMKSGEEINRAVAGAIGRAGVKTAFNDFHSGVNVEHAKRYFEMLTARPIESVDKVTPDLERFAAYRMAEVTQGLNDPLNLPHGWSDPVNNYMQVSKQLALIFKKVGFQVTKSVKDSIMMQPTPKSKAAVAATWLVLGQAGGELVSDIRSGLTGRERPENPVARAIQNWGNVFLLGMPWEMAVSTQYGPSAMLGAVAGPAFGKGSELGYQTFRTGQNLIQDANDPMAPLRQYGIRNLPIPGRERLKDTDLY